MEFGPVQILVVGFEHGQVRGQDPRGASPPARARHRPPRRPALRHHDEERQPREDRAQRPLAGGGDGVRRPRRRARRASAPTARRAPRPAPSPVRRRAEDGSILDDDRGLVHRRRDPARARRPRSRCSSTAGRSRSAMRSPRPAATPWPTLGSTPRIWSRSAPPAGDDVSTLTPPTDLAGARPQRPRSLAGRARRTRSSRRLRSEAPLHWSELGDFDHESPASGRSCATTTSPRSAATTRPSPPQRSIILVDKLETDPDKPDPMDLARST